MRGCSERWKLLYDDGHHVSFGHRHSSSRPCEVDLVAEISNIKDELDLAENPIKYGDELIFSVSFDTISKKYDIDKQKDSIVSGDNSFTYLYAAVESDIEKAETASNEKGRASMVVINSEIH
ncbi:hypothetical protein ACH5RR_024846 [Cinchona calisaya]|uniref:Uncharacterized protein n=1 Tax=Cinchona calisaya TaxID=153742 RepID=A0ABD2YXY2_9GENT